MSNKSGGSLGRPLVYILLVVLAALGIAYTQKDKWASKPEPLEDPDSLPVDPGIAEMQTPLSERPLAGEEPEADPKFNVQIELDTNSGSGVMHFTLIEEHGYYVEAPQIRFWKKGDERNFIEQPYENRFLTAGGSLRLKFSFTPFELADKFKNDLGTADDWEASVTFGRAREKNPDPLPLIYEKP